jgi:adenylate kinase
MPARKRSENVETILKAVAWGALGALVLIYVDTHFLASSGNGSLTGLPKKV